MEFSRYNTGWNGTSSFFSDLDRHRTVDIRDPALLENSGPNATLLIIAPRKHPTPQQMRAYRAFLEQGNTLVIADDFGTGNEIIAGIGSRITILPGNLSSLDRRYSDPYSVVAYRAAGDDPFNLPDNVVLNRPAALEGGTPLILTSVMSWIDANGDVRLNFGENMGTFPVMVLEPRGQGRLLILSDPSIFINSMYSPVENANNRILVRSLLSGDGPVLIDTMNSRTSETGGTSEIFQVVRTNGSIELLLLSLLMLMVALAWKNQKI